MRGNPLMIESLTGLTQHGKAQVDYLGLLLLQAAVLFLWWPKNDVAQALESLQGPHALAAVVMAVGLTTAYFAVRAGAEEILLPGQRILSDWALATRLGVGRIVLGYVMGQLVHSVHLLVLSAPLLLAAFTISGGEWAALAWCLLAVVVQALFYRLCGAITHLALGQNRAMSFFVVRAMLLLVYVGVGWLAPVTSHLAFTHRELAQSAATQSALATVPDRDVFLLTYAVLAVLAALALHRLLRRERRGTPDSRNGSGADQAVPG